MTVDIQYFDLTDVQLPHICLDRGQIADHDPRERFRMHQFGTSRQ